MMKKRPIANRSPLNDVAGRFTPYVYLLPTVSLVVIFLIYPLFETFRYSFFSWDGIGKMTFIGLRNYISVLHDARFLSALQANLIYIVFFSLIPAAFGLLIASLIGRTRLQGIRYFRTVFFIPQVIPSVAIGTIFGWIYAPQFGVLNEILGILGLRTWGRAWLGSGGTAPFAVGLIGTWLWTGFCVIIFLAGIQKIDEHLYDAAKIDGANTWRQLLSITLPELRYEIVVVLITTTIRALSTNVFGIVSTATGGANATRPISLYAYQLAFIQHEFGYASAVVALLAVLVFAISSITMLVGEER